MSSIGNVKNFADWYEMFTAQALSASISYLTMPAIVIGDAGLLSVQALIDNGSGAAPSDTPVGYWELWISANDVRYTRFTNTAVDAVLAGIGPNGNTLIDAWACFSGMPGRFARFGYHRTSGGAGDSRATLIATVR